MEQTDRYQRGGGGREWKWLAKDYTCICAHMCMLWTPKTTWRQGGEHGLGGEGRCAVGEMCFICSSNCIWSWQHHDNTLSGFAAFLDLELKLNQGLDVLSHLTETLWSQQTWGFVPKIIWCWSEPRCLQGLILKGVLLQERKQMTQSAGCGQFESKEKKGEKVILKK